MAKVAGKYSVTGTSRRCQNDGSGYTFITGKSGGKTMETARINEVLGLKIGEIKEYASKLEAKDVKRLAADLAVIETAVREMKDLLAGLPR